MSEFASLIKTPTYRLMVDLPLGVCVVLLYASFHPNIPLSKMAEGLLVYIKESTAVLWFVVIALSVAGEILATAGDMVVNRIFDIRTGCDRGSDNTYLVERVCPQQYLYCILIPLTAIFVFCLLVSIVDSLNSIARYLVAGLGLVFLIFAWHIRVTSLNESEYITVGDFRTAFSGTDNFHAWCEIHYVAGRFFSGLFVLCAVVVFMSFIWLQSWLIGFGAAGLSAFSLAAAIHYRTFANKLLYKVPPLLLSKRRNKIL